MAIMVDTPLRQISITTSDKKSYRFDEYHGFAELTITDRFNDITRFDCVEVEYQELFPGSRFTWFEIGYDGTLSPHQSAPIVSVNLSSNL
jgi:hypothetical protein